MPPDSSGVRPRGFGGPGRDGAFGTGEAASPRGSALVANLNVFRVPELDPRHHDVRSWTWSDGAPARTVLATLERDAAARLSRVPGGAEIAAGYVGGKRVLPGDARWAMLRAVRWLLGELRRADRVLVGVPPAARRDRLLWLALVTATTLVRRPLLFYSETWLEPRGARHAPRRALDRLLAALATVIVVPGRRQEEHYRRLGRGAKLRRIGSPYDPPPPPAAVDRRVAEPPELLFVGRSMPIKGLDRLLDLVDELDGEGRPVRVVALLHDPGNQFRGRDAGYAERCRARLRSRDPALTEVHLERVDVGAFYRRSTLLVVPNRIVARDKVPGESWGRVVPEALAAGLPVVSTDAVPSAVEYVVDGGNGAVVPWDDETALGAAVRHWLWR